MELPFDTPTMRRCSSGWRMKDPSSVRPTNSVDVGPRTCANAGLRVRAQLRADALLAEGLRPPHPPALVIGAGNQDLRLRAEGVITESTTEFVIRLGDVEQTVGVTLMRFRNGRSWSYFVCPCCGGRARTLKLFNGQLLRSRCCRAIGLLYKSDPMSVRQRAERRIPQLRAMLESKEPLRLKPSTLWGTMERRPRHEAALRKAEFRVAQRGSPRKKVEAIIDPCDEPDFVAPKPRPRLKT